MSTFVAGQNRETAKALLGAAEGLGLDPSVVVAVSGGFEVPDEILEALDSIEGVEDVTEEEGTDEGSEEESEGEGTDEDSEEKSEEVVEEPTEEVVEEVKPAAKPKASTAKKKEGEN